MKNKIKKNIKYFKNIKIKIYDSALPTAFSIV